MKQVGVVAPHILHGPRHHLEKPADIRVALFGLPAAVCREKGGEGDDAGEDWGKEGRAALGQAPNKCLGSLPLPLPSLFTLDDPDDLGKVRLAHNEREGGGEEVSHEVQGRALGP